jgi:hypothetical protein
MVVDLNDVAPFFTWLPSALWLWILVVVCVGLGATVIAWLIAALMHGPRKAVSITGQVVASAADDLAHISPRHVGALAWLAIKEAIRRRVVVVFGVFILLVSFAGWFLDPGSVDPARRYLDFVLTWTGGLMLLLVLFLSSLSLPTDIKNRTLHTIVTKPVRASEVVLGRIVGFTAVATFLLVVMGAISFVFVWRGLAHDHQLTADDLQTVEGAVAGRAVGFQGSTTRARIAGANPHRHKVTIGSAGEGRVETEQGHWHRWIAAKQGDKTTYTIGPEEGMLMARVPVYGKLEFRDRTGKPADKGISVGDEWTYRGYIEGGSNAAAVWTFQGVTPERFPKGLPVALTLGIFRTYKGDIEKGVLGALAVKNPKTGKKAEVKLFESKAYVIDEQNIPREFRTPAGEKIDLFRDMVSDGRIEVWLQCAERAQYLGVAQADMYLRAANAYFGLNFVKGYVGIWLQTLVVIALGVMFSTFLSGPVAMLATLGTLVGGYCHDFMVRLATGQTYGGGPFESIIRIWTQQNVTSEAAPGLQTAVAQTLDQVAQSLLWILAMVLPDFGKFNFSDFVAYGFGIPGDMLLQYVCRALGFVVPVFVVGYLCLKNREIAQQ